MKILTKEQTDAARNALLEGNAKGLDKDRSWQVAHGKGTDAVEPARIKQAFLDEALRNMADRYIEIRDWGNPGETRVGMTGQNGASEMRPKSSELAKVREQMAKLIQQGANPALLPEGVTVEDCRVYLE